MNHHQVQGLDATRPASAPHPASRAPGQRSVAPAGFEALLGGNLRGADASARTGAVRWSAHAVDRLTHGRIPVSADMQRRIQGAVDDLSAKGARESLVLVDGLALVVSVTNRTVITAVGPERMNDQIFTNIDSAAVR